MKFQFYYMLTYFGAVLLSFATSVKIFTITPYPQYLEGCLDNPTPPCSNLSSFALSHNISNTDSPAFMSLNSRSNHILDKEFVIRNASIVVFLSSRATTTITCRGRGRFVFEDIYYLRITDIRFVGCGDINVSSVVLFELEDSYFNGRGANSDTGIIFNHVLSVTIVRSVFSSYVVDGPKERYHKQGGAITIFQSNAKIKDTIFQHNNVSLFKANSGGAVYAWKSDVIFENCTFRNNTIQHLGGGALFARTSNITITRNCTFSENTVDSNSGGGSAIHVRRSFLTIDDAKFVNNKVKSVGSAVMIRESSSNINNSVFHDNDVGVFVTSHHRDYVNVVTIQNSNFSEHSNGAVGVIKTNLNVNKCTFVNNHIWGSGGAISASRSPFVTTVCTVMVQNSVFFNNSASTDGGAISVQRINHLNLTNCTFIGNRAPAGFGAALYSYQTPFTSSESLVIRDHHGILNVVYAVQSEMKLLGNTMVSNNYGTFFVINSDVTFNGITKFVNNTRGYCSKGTFRICKDINEGGAITSFQSSLVFEGNTLISGNEAHNGGAISATESVFSMGAGGEMTISHNRVLVSGGGIYAYQSELNFLGRSIIANNTAHNGGGGIFAISATTKLKDGRHYVHSNHANHGGGMYLESSAKLYIVKTRTEYICTNCANVKLDFSKNSATYGGAIYVNDDKTSGICASSASGSLYTASNECFFQSLVFYRSARILVNTPFENRYNIRNAFFANNTASVDGDTLYGGLLDRCIVSPLAEKSTEHIPFNIFKTTDISKHGISSEPVRVCFCNGEEPDCTYQPDTLHVRRGGTFTLSAVAVDQVGKPLPSNVHSLLKLQGGAFKEGQLIQNTSGVCTKLEYNIYSPHESEELLLFAEGPCRDVGISQRSVYVTFLPCTCPIGFQPSTSLTNCECVCDPALKPHITNCSIETESVMREGDFWITFVSDNDTNTSEGSIYIHPQCPLDYCVSSAVVVSVNLNLPSGADSQCAFNRSGTLCGSCKEGLSLTLGSSHCMTCSNYWLVLLIPFAVAGISLVIVILVLNLTVAVGTINGLIFYANIVITNSAIFFPLGMPHFMNVFIAWLNEHSY